MNELNSVKDLNDFRKQLDSLSDTLNFFKPDERDKAIKILQECIEDCKNSFTLVEVESEGISNKVQNNDGPSNCPMLRSENSKLEKSIAFEGFESNVYKRSAPIGTESVKLPEHSTHNRPSHVEKTSSDTNAEDLIFISEESDLQSEDDCKTSLKCLKCEKKYENKRNLLEHVQSHSGKPKSCSDCPKLFQNSLAFKCHKQLGMCVKSSKVFKCKLCKRLVYGESQYNAHLSAHKRNQCKTCGDHFSRQKHLEIHIVNVHNGAINKDLFRCHICSRQFTQRRSLVYHLKLTHPGSDVMCEVCLEMFKNSEDLETHLASHKLTTFTCDKCGQTFSRRQQYQLHVKEHEKYKCKMCSEGFSSKKAAEAHAATGHSVQGLEPQLQCAQCGQLFLTRSQLNNHMMEHTGEKKLYCEKCKLTFKRLWNYRNHLESNEHLQGDAPKQLLACPQCGKTFTNKNNLRVHISRVHKANKEHACPHCDYKTKVRNNLKRHIASHTEKPQFVCDKCGGQFHTKASLQEHDLRLHNDSKDFSCDKCGTVFSRSSDLNRHLLNKHSEAALYSCHCGNSYKSLSNLKRHQLLGHRQVDKPKRIKKLFDGKTGKKKKDKVESATSSEGLQLLESQVQEVSSVMNESNVVVMSDNSEQLLQVSYSMDFAQDKSQVVYTQSLDMSGLQVVDSMIQLENHPKQSSNLLINVRNLFGRNDYILPPPIGTSMVNSLDNTVATDLPDIAISSQKQNVITGLQEYIIPNELNFLNV
ncbi:zinc finger protein 699-like isoform X2 [Macrosteles quadrilineatus]|uniref:zinc finger protein 699-like isoform X2 n=1 Tax=Macrosteles quadrilineatus TaxID=74068 RepID=UPI0023E0FF8A|nr:zinc finger protein 699-like isoform X2 [Macrosteles quadrilineatus]